MDPLNWAKCLPFFCSMDKEHDRPDGWSRVLEHVSTTCPIRRDAPDGDAAEVLEGAGHKPPTTVGATDGLLDYALDDDPAAGEKGDGRMVVDDGFIRMTSTSREFGAKTAYAYVPRRLPASAIWHFSLRRFLPA